MKILSVVGARPQFVKLAAVAPAVAEAGHEHVIVHTGQHYDTAMSQVFFDGLGIARPDTDLGVGSGGHGRQTGQTLERLDAALAEHAPDWVLVYGDTNATLAGAIAAAKLHVPVAHLEAGLRSFNRRMPEEVNRVLADHACDLLLAPTAQAMRHLDAEGLGARSVLTGDVMVDVCLRVGAAVEAADAGAGAGEDAAGQLPGDIAPGEPFVLATLHRAENTDDPQRLEGLLRAVSELDVPVLLPVHPRLRARTDEYGIPLRKGAIVPVEPLDYAGTVRAVRAASAVVTDSGGMQKEAFLLGRVCTTLRTETEWPETLADGWNTLVADPAALNPGGLEEIVLRPAPDPAGPSAAPFGTPGAAARAVRALEERG
ncbi:non-hydrolyzing UDP-N-acetylglucosamine 2-epimerase [Nocardiopsis coralliicola]